MSTMSKASADYTFNVAPGQEGRNDTNYKNLEVNILQYPTREQFLKLMSKASVAVRGNIVGDEEIDETMAEDMLRGGLNQSLEWMQVIFEVGGVSRGVTHQLVRTRKASFAQQSMRYANMGTFNTRVPTEISNNPVAFAIWLEAIEASRKAYGELTAMGIPMQDARTVCPIATQTYIICSYPLNEFLSLYSYRACQMFYPEMVVLMGLMREKLIEVCPWLEPHIKISCEKTGPGINDLPHKCMYQGFEKVEGQCTFEWAKEDNRIYKSSKVKG
jgi:flavin-dependent thymidylate synthase